MPLNFKLLVGLGNPTVQYKNTRHNAGFWFLDRVAAQYCLDFQPDRRFRGDIAKMDLAGQSLYLLKPATYMNRSGESVGALAGYLKLQTEQILVAHDELNLSPGAVRLKFGGGHGGHNGLRDLTLRLGSPSFYRLRFGIGHPGDKAEVVGYVLGIPSPGEEQLIIRTLEKAVSVLPKLLKGQLDLAVNELHVPNHV